MDFGGDFPGLGTWKKASPRGTRSPFPFRENAMLSIARRLAKLFLGWIQDWL